MHQDITNGLDDISSPDKNQFLRHFTNPILIDSSDKNMLRNIGKPPKRAAGGE